MGRLGARKGVIRGNDSSDAIYVNGHYPVPPLTRDAILAHMHRTARPVIAAEVAAELHLSVSHVQRAMRYMARDGDIRHENPGCRGNTSIFSLRPLR